MMADSNELIVIVKMYDLIKWSCEHISRFPRNYRFVLGERIETNLLDILELLIAAKFSKDRVALLTKTNSSSFGLLRMELSSNSLGSSGEGSFFLRLGHNISQRRATSVSSQDSTMSGLDLTIR